MHKRLPVLMGLLITAAWGVSLLGAGAYQKQQSFTVPGNSGRNWVDTGLDIPPGMAVILDASGVVDVGAGWGKFGPEGTTKFANVFGYPADTRYRYGLVARLTQSGKTPDDELKEDWSYGEQPQHCSGQGGHLWLTVNDDAPEDNTGEFIVSVRYYACSPNSVACDQENGRKVCNGQCIYFDLPQYGCSRQGCAACYFPHAVPACEFTSLAKEPYVCTWRRCEDGWTDLDGDRSNGCEFHNPNLIVWLDASYGVNNISSDPGNPFAARVVSRWIERQIEFSSATEQHANLWPAPSIVGDKTAVRFGPDRKSLYIVEQYPQSPDRFIDMNNTAYTVFAVVQRDSARGDNYFLLTDGSACGLAGCAANSALHLGWQSDRTIRLGQYYNDLDLREVPPFNRAQPPLSLIIASSDTTGKFISLDEAGFSRQARNTEGTLLRQTGVIGVGGTDPPDFHFSGNIFEIMIYNARLSGEHFDAVKNYLRRKYRI